MKKSPITEEVELGSVQSAKAKKDKHEVVLGFIILCFLFFIAVIVVIAGYHYVVGFGIAESASVRNLLSAERGTAIIIIGIFLEILIGVLIFEFKFTQLISAKKKAAETIFKQQQKTNQLLEILISKK